MSTQLMNRVLMLLEEADRQIIHLLSTSVEVIGVVLLGLLLITVVVMSA